MRSRFSAAVIRMALVVAALGFSGNALADLLLDTSSVTPFITIPSGGETIGWAFTVSSPLNVAALGIFDLDGAVLTETHQVGLWNSDGTLLAQTAIDASSSPIISMNPANQWVFTNITPMILPPGIYILGATYINESDGFGNGTGITTIANVSFDGERQHSGNGTVLTFPEGSFPFSPGVFGPNISTIPVPEVPEPSSLLLVATGIGAIIIMGLRRRQPVGKAIHSPLLFGGP